MEEYVEEYKEVGKRTRPKKKKKKNIMDRAREAIKEKEEKNAGTRSWE